MFFSGKIKFQPIHLARSVLSDVDQFDQILTSHEFWTFFEKQIWQYFFRYHHVCPWTETKQGKMFFFLQKQNNGMKSIFNFLFFSLLSKYDIDVEIEASFHCFFIWFSDCLGYLFSSNSYLLISMDIIDFLIKIK